MRRLLIMLSAAILVGAPAWGQQTKKRQTLGQKIKKTWRKGTKEVSDATYNLGKELGISSGAKRGEAKVNGTYYMYLYTANVYHGSDSGKLIGETEKIFKKRYPAVKILSCVIPQTDWEVTEEEQDGNVVGYRRTLFCYVLGKDGADGYINAKFTYEQYRPAGGAEIPVQGKWPEWTRTDVIPAKDYWELVTK